MVLWKFTTAKSYDVLFVSWCLHKWFSSSKNTLRHLIIHIKMPPWGLPPRTKGVLTIESEPHIYDDEAVRTQTNLHSWSLLNHTFVHENKSAHWTEAAHFSQWLTVQMLQLTSLSQNEQFSFISEWNLKVHYDTKERDQCSMHQREPISMTQPALSGVSTKLRAHLLPVGHRQNPQCYRSRSLKSTPLHRYRLKRPKYEEKKIPW